MMEERGLNTLARMGGMLVGGEAEGVRQVGTFVRGQQMLSHALI